MTAPLSREDLQELADALEGEGAVHLYRAGDPALAHLPALPPAWQGHLADADRARASVLADWEALQGTLPLTVQALHDTLQTVVLAVTSSVPASLLYVLREGDEILAQRGFLPAQETDWQGVPAMVRAQVQPFYALHNGWVDLFAGDGGPLPVRTWRRSPSQQGQGLLLTYSQGGHFAGFDLDSPTCQTYGVWPQDGEVDELAEFWPHVDEQMAESLVDCDPVDEADPQEDV